MHVWIMKIYENWKLQLRHSVSSSVLVYTTMATPTCPVACLSCYWNSP